MAQQEPYSFGAAAYNALTVKSNNLGYMRSTKSQLIRATLKQSVSNATIVTQTTPTHPSLQLVLRHFCLRQRNDSGYSGMILIFLSILYSILLFLC